MSEEATTPAGPAPVEGETTATDGGPPTVEDEMTSQPPERTVCPDTDRKQGLVGAYDIQLCRQSFREKARDIGFRKYE